MREELATRVGGSEEANVCSLPTRSKPIKVTDESVRDCCDEIPKKKSKGGEKVLGAGVQ